MKKSFKYDVFISYKRNGGTPWAELLFLVLDKIAGKRVFIDRHGLKGGMYKKWESSINEAIENSINVVVVVFPGIQNVIKEKDDVFVKEIAKALKEKENRIINIIPFYVEGLSSELIHSSDQYLSLPDELKTITSPDYADISFSPKYKYAWIDVLLDSLISETEILEETCYRVQVNAISKMIVYDDSHSMKDESKDKIRSLDYNGADTIYWVEKNNGYLVLRFEAEDGYKYMVTIDTTDKYNESKTPKEYAAYYNLKGGVFPSDGIFRVIDDTIILTIDWDIIKSQKSNKRVERILGELMPSHKSSEFPLIDSALRNLKL